MKITRREAFCPSVCTACYESFKLNRELQPFCAIRAKCNENCRIRERRVATNQDDEWIGNG
jgi:hypothetical protein